MFIVYRVVMYIDRLSKYNLQCVLRGHIIGNRGHDLSLARRMLIYILHTGKRDEDLLQVISFKPSLSKIFICDLRRLDILGRFFCHFYKGDNFCDFLFAYLCTNPLLKGVFSKMKEFAPTGSKFFPFRVDPF